MREANLVESLVTLLLFVVGKPDLLSEYLASLAKVLDVFHAHRCWTVRDIVQQG
jgi:hypothetical protein